jgi:hypothetical protein
MRPETTAPTAPAATPGELPLELRIAQTCNRELSHVTPDVVLARVQPEVPELDFRYATARSGWHRLGGVVDADHRPIATNIEIWAEQESRGDMDLLLDKCAELRGFVTKLQGSTHYLTAATGTDAGDFIQVEIEQVQEVIDRPLWDPDWLPDDLADFCDPLDFPHLDPEPVGPPRLLFRRLVRVADFLASEDAGRRIKRFFGDWDRSSAGESARFCEHWILSMRDYRDTQGDDRLNAKPIPLLLSEESALAVEQIGRGAALANLIHAFDRRCGYHFAWYFHMLSRRRVSHELAEAVHSDLMGAFDYLPAKDIAVLRDWYDNRYSV